jgi:hypothetical protein
MRSHLAALGAALLTLAASLTPAHACDGDPNVRAVLGPLPAALSGMRVEIHRTLAVQLVLANPTARTLEILDDAGVPFIRIGPRGVEGNLAARAWYATYSPIATAPRSIGDGPARWVRVSDEPAFGWFEPRLDAAQVVVPDEVRGAGTAVEVGRWRIAMRLDGAPMTLSGPFRFESPARGRYRSRLTSPAEVAPGVRVRLLPGAVPGLLVESASPQTLIVFGIVNEPFLRISPRGVEANVRSTTWRQSARRFSAPEDAEIGDEPKWQSVARVPRYSWIEPRATPPSHTVAGERKWSVPMQIGTERLEVTGAAVWRES